MSEERYLQEQATRKSTRPRVFNYFYTKDITEYGKIAAKQRRKGRSEDDEEGSYFDGRMDAEDSQRIADQVWFPCRFPNESSMIKVQFVRQTQEQPKRQQGMKQLLKKQPPSETSFDLLSLFKNAINDVERESKEVPEGPKHPPYLKPSRPPLITPMKKRNDECGQITGVSLENGVLKLKHSKLGDYEIPMKWEITKKISNDEDERIIKEYRQRLLDSNLLKNIAIFS